MSVSLLPRVLDSVWISSSPLGDGLLQRADEPLH